MREISRNDHLHEPSILDDEDLQLVHALQIAPRASWTSLAPILGVHSTTLATRWKRLSEAGIAWIAVHSIGTRLTPVTAFIEVLCEMSRREEVIRELSEIPDVLSLDISARHRDLLLTVSAASMAHLTEHTLPRIASVRGIEHIETSFSTRMHVIADSWTVRSLSPEQARQVAQLNPRERSDGPAPRISPDVLRALAADGRLSASDIARGLGMSEPTVRRQIRAAILHGLVHFRCELAQDVSGTPITAEWFASVPATEHETLARAAAQIPGIRLCASTTGRTNVLLTFWLRSVSEVPRVEGQLTAAVPSIVFRESAIALRIAKRVGWLLGDGGRATGRVIPPWRE
ncbi:AsnC family transcriptional regulator [Leucobacter luti]|uniref:AsnC family transcriptional regulator n=1 Tax=Leucobacter luti TaxID=340320 RepID=A0A4R6RXN7_9MICO|nr:Lrp/AsnC family transcriptional regulator [Leucobacter luti]MCW2289792.1 DNA-binding Lrp family transcriptional regulator [Leucobacter luti]TCK34328.1 AsnC family transcriptional regulator [Leucobacter luti]TDP90956.1 AsnC family transcriptional regulator [Leucobacter luti]